MPEAVLVSAVRTPVGRAPKGALSTTRPDDLAATALSGALDKIPELNRAEVDDVILGCAQPEGEQGWDIARWAALRAGLPVDVPGVTVNRLCSSGLEAIALADWMAVMVDGRILQTGPVREVFARPASAQVAEAVGVENILPAEIVSRAGGLLRLRVGSAALECLDGGESGPVLVSIRAEDVALTRDPARASTQRNRLSGVVRAIAIEGALARVEMDCGFPLVALVTAQSAADLDLLPGESLAAIVKTTSVHLIAAG